MPGSVVYRFGPFELNMGSRTLFRHGKRVDLKERHISILALLPARAGTVVSKDDLMRAGWNRIMGENSVLKVLSDLRQAVGDGPGGVPYFETYRTQGSRFTGDCTCEETGEHAVADILMAPHRRWTEGRAALERLTVDDVRRAIVAFEEAVHLAPTFAPAHVGLANARLMDFESTRADAEPNRASLEAALHHAREATRLDPLYGEAWATLAFALARAGRFEEAFHAAQHATMIEPDNWRHWVRLALVSWGEQRLRAARRALQLKRGFPFAHFLAATVFIGRQDFDRALAEVQAGLAGLAQQRRTGEPLSGIALHWLHGLLLYALGDAAGALAAFERELASEGAGHIYARECCAHTWHAIGAMRMHDGDLTGAIAAFTEALTRVPAHPLAQAGMAIASAAGAGLAPPATSFTSAPLSPEALIACAALLDATGQHDDAAAMLAAGLEHTAIHGAGWVLPIEPLLGVLRHPETWSAALERVSASAM